MSYDMGRSESSITAPHPGIINIDVFIVQYYHFRSIKDPALEKESRVKGTVINAL